MFVLCRVCTARINIFSWLCLHWNLLWIKFSLYFFSLKFTFLNLTLSLKVYLNYVNVILEKWVYLSQNKQIVYYRQTETLKWFVLFAKHILFLNMNEQWSCRQFKTFLRISWWKSGVEKASYSFKYNVHVTFFVFYQMNILICFFPFINLHPIYRIFISETGCLISIINSIL